MRRERWLPSEEEHGKAKQACGAAGRPTEDELQSPVQGTGKMVVRAANTKSSAAEGAGEREFIGHSDLARWPRARVLHLLPSPLTPRTVIVKDPSHSSTAKTPGPWKVLDPTISVARSGHNSPFREGEQLDGGLDRPTACFQPLASGHRWSESRTPPSNGSGLIRIPWTCTVDFERRSISISIAHRRLPIEDNTLVMSILAVEHRTELRWFGGYPSTPVLGNP
ncbi:hypothetical protein CSOJ01_11846 [Colletotrichum sojae]|uniref:Uncharacterized protein n=1 Tax=Colletotrichum sojae TaxID=2175907 RepID=A0A8H6IX95_9PEZI|nr:hypothetical protein CSOJ01_11846 [Colletotrichum sojae]